MASDLAAWAPVAVWLEREIGFVVGPERYHLLDSHCRELVKVRHLSSPKALIDLACIDRAVRQEVINAVAINESYFFRDTALWGDLGQRILPELAAEIPRGRAIKVLMCACSHGQEIYTLAMTVQEHAAALRGLQMEITATDIDTEALAIAQAGVYSSIEIGRGLDQARRDRWFQPHGESWQVKPELKRGSSFVHLNLNTAFTFAQRFDLVLCRNVLIYFSPENRRRIVERLAEYTNGFGYLVLGGAETLLGVTDRWHPRRIGSSTLHQKSVGPPPLRAP